MRRLLHDRFELLAPLGAGGVGTVWRSRDLRSGQAVALKVLHPHLRSDPLVAERFRREAGLGKLLSHANVVRAYELFEDSDALSFSLELLEGRTLKEEILSSGPLSIEEVVRIARHCLSGLGAAHAAGVIHRDFKSQNVFLGASGAVKVLDFGSARVASAAGLTTRSLVLCTPDYAAPETVMAQPTDGRTDLYSLGVVLYEALTGRLPFRGTSPFELLQRHLNDPLPSPRALRPEIPVRLDTLVRRLMAKPPQDRFSTCELVLEALSTSTKPLPVPGASCPACQAPRDSRWSLCPTCGTTERGHAAGDFMVVLTRAPAAAVPTLRALLHSVGATPCRSLQGKDSRVVSSLPKVILKGIGEPLARLIRDRAIAGELQVEVRKQSENNSDLLHKGNTPSYLFVMGLAVPWIAALGWAIETQLEHGRALPVGLAVAGPAVAWGVARHAHRFLPPLATLERLAPVAQLPPSLVARFRDALPQLSDPSLKGTLTRLFERALVIHVAANAGKPHVQMLLEETAHATLRVAARAVEMALEAQGALDRVKLAGEADRLQELEVLRSRLAQAPNDANLAAALAEKEQALAAVEVLEQAHLVATHRLLKAASALEVTAVQSVLAHATTATGISVQLAQVLEEAEFAGRSAREITRETTSSIE